MVKVIGVRFRRVGKIYYFDPLDMDIKQSDHVIVETARGVEYGYVVLGIREVAEDKVILPLKPVFVLQRLRMMNRSLTIRQRRRTHSIYALRKLRSMVLR